MAEELRRHGVEVITGVAVNAIERDGNRLVVRAAEGVRTRVTWYSWPRASRPT